MGCDQDEAGPSDIAQEQSVMLCDAVRCAKCWVLGKCGVFASLGPHLIEFLGDFHTSLHDTC
eukprot:6709487-Prymnesium_polylepis.1